MVKQPQQASTRVALNTGILYTKMLITMGISFYSTRLVLNALGASDYGIFNLIAGVIAMLSFLNAAMTVSTQRYLSFHQGTGDVYMQKKVFVNSWILHIVIGVVVVSLLLILVPFLFNDFLNIPTNRIAAAKSIYYFMSVSVFFTIISVPFTASLNAHENMLWIAIVNIIEAFIKLGIAILLVCFIQSERLMVYGVLVAALSVITFLLYTVYCLKQYDECSIKKYQIDRSLFKELGGFAGWNLFGALSGTARMQATAVILNIFFGTIVNAAYGIANQISGQLYYFSASLLRVVNPQIMKSEGMNDRQRMLIISMSASRLSFFLMTFFSVPIIFEMPTILKLWLKNVPEYTVFFCSLNLIAMLVNQLTIGLESAVQAIGKIKVYQFIVGSLFLSNIPIAYVLLKLGFSAHFILISNVLIYFIVCIFRIAFFKKNVGVSIRDYCKQVFLKIFISLITIILICWTITNYMDFEYRFLFTILISSIFFVVSVYFTGLSKEEKMLVNKIINKVLKGKLRRSI